MGFQLWMADVLRAAGLRVVEVDGWRTRGRYDDSGTPLSFDPIGLIAHETRGSATSSVSGEINVMINGREGLSGPIAHWLLARDGVWHVVNSGRSNHVLTGWAGIFKGYGNSRLMGIEAQHAAGEPWTQVQYDSYVRGAAAICKHKGWQVGGHKEHQPYPPPPGETSTKTDPAFDMNQFRAAVAAALSGDDMSWTEKPAGTTYTYGELTFGTNVAAWKAVGLLEAIAKQVGIDADELAAITAAAKAGAAAAVLESADELVAAFVDAIPEGAHLTRDDLRAAAETAVRNVLGTLDGATPPTT